MSLAAQTLRALTPSLAICLVIFASAGKIAAQENDQPLPKAEIKLLRKQDGKWLPVNFTWEVSRIHRKDLRTNPNGVYRIAGLPAGDYLVRASESPLDIDKLPLPDDVYRSGSFMMGRRAYHSRQGIGDPERPRALEGRWISRRGCRRASRKSGSCGTCAARVGLRLLIPRVCSH